MKRLSKPDHSNGIIELKSCNGIIELISFGTTSYGKQMSIFGIIITIVVMLFNLWYFRHVSWLGIIIIDCGTTYFGLVSGIFWSISFGTTHCDKKMLIFLCCHNNCGYVI